MAREKKQEEISAQKQRQLEAEKERGRAQRAFATILATMADIERSDVSHAAVELWRKKLNQFRAWGDKIKAKDFFALAEQGDPFNADAEAHRELAEWFVEQWHRFKPGAQTVHVRGLHYAISALAGKPEAVYLPNGKLYDNTDLRWDDLQRAGKYARYLGLIDPGRFEDRRSHAAVVKPFSTSARSLSVFDDRSAFDFVELPGWSDFPDFPTMPPFPSPPRYSLGLRGQQRYRLEVWIEKSTQESVILPVCDRYQVTSVTAQGEISITSMWDAVRRAEQYGELTTTVILYISDFDPAGKSMPIAAGRKLEYLRRYRGSKVNMRVYAIALTYEQCLQYQLPRTPLKESDKRKQGFEDRYGTGATELDALESLYPGELARLLETAILRFHDPNIHARVSRKQQEIMQELADIQRAIHARSGLNDLREEYHRVADALGPLEDRHWHYKLAYQELMEQYDDDVRQQFERWSEQLLEPLKKKVHEIMRHVALEMHETMPDIQAYDLPQAQEVPLATDCLYDSERPYVNQLAAYKLFAGKFSHLVEEENGEEASI